MEKSGAKGPDKCKHKPDLIDLFRGISWNVLRDDECLKKAAEDLNVADRWNWSYLLELFSNDVNADWDVLVKQKGQVGFLTQILSCLNPAGDLRIPS